MRTPQSSVAGFTLTELLVVISIVGILAMIAIPSFKSLTESQRVKNASFEMFTILSLARSEAIKRNGDVTVLPVFSGGTLTGITIAASGVTLDSKPAPKGVEIGPSTAASAGVTYTRSGRTTASNLSFEIDVAGATTPTAHVRCITVELSGMPRTRRSACP